MNYNNLNKIFIIGIIILILIINIYIIIYTNTILLKNLDNQLSITPNSSNIIPITTTFPSGLLQYGNQPLSVNTVVPSNTTGSSSTAVLSSTTGPSNIIPPGLLQYDNQQLSENTNNISTNLSNNSHINSLTIASLSLIIIAFLSEIPFIYYIMSIDNYDIDFTSLISISFNIISSISSIVCLSIIVSSSYINSLSIVSLSLNSLTFINHFLLLLINFNDINSIDYIFIICNIIFAITSIASIGCLSSLISITNKLSTISNDQSPKTQTLNNQSNIDDPNGSSIYTPQTTTQESSNINPPQTFVDNNQQQLQSTADQSNGSSNQNNKQLYPYGFLQLGSSIYTPQTTTQESSNINPPQAFVDNNQQQLQSTADQSNQNNKQLYPYGFLQLGSLPNIK